jgi:undecaprenyl-diphosphatase
MSFLYFLEQLRTPFLDTFFSLFTLFGDETLFIAVAMVVFWCMDKKQGYYLFGVGMFGTILNQFLKVVCHVPRPWVKDPAFTVVESAREGAGGYSFPSGHTQSSVGLFGGIARWNKQKWVRIVTIVMCVIVPFSRMYLGVHTPADVLTSIGIALVLIFVGYPLFQKAGDNPRLMYAIFGSITLLLVGYLCYLHRYPFADATNENLLEAKENAYTLLGCMVGLPLIYLLDTTKIHFPTKAVWWAQVLKMAGGLILLLAVKSLLKAPLNAVIDNQYIARALRYFLVVLTGGALWPLTFRHFAKLGKKTK